MILLALLSNSWKAIRIAVSNSVGKTKLKYDYIRDLVLANEVRKKDSGKLLCSKSALNVDNQGKGNRRDAKGSNRDRKSTRLNSSHRP